jgi:hypothetical protein
MPRADGTLVAVEFYSGIGGLHYSLQARQRRAS